MSKFPECRIIEKSQWMKEGTELFGHDMYSWKFVCPVCGNIASVEEYRQFKDKGATPSSAYQECIGRYTEGRSAFHDNEGKPCDYAAYGLFGMCRTEVVDNSGNKIAVFEFALDCRMSGEVE